MNAPSKPSWGRRVFLYSFPMFFSQHAMGDVVVPKGPSENRLLWITVAVGFLGALIWYRRKARDAGHS